MSSLLQLFVYIPLLGFILCSMAPRHHEKLIAKIALYTTTVNALMIVSFALYWSSHAHVILTETEYTLYHSDEYEFNVAFYFDKITLVFSLLGSLLGFIITLYSSRYLHREKDYKPFFLRLLFFYVGYFTVVFSGNFETLFIGWEILGISSFLLIAFYKDRYFPVKNALKIFSIYRIADVGLLLAMWMCHHLFHQNITFYQLINHAAIHSHFQNHSFIGALMAFAILIAAAAKSAQLPFSSWLPRAMEGPTPSSAIFYGSLSVHIGAFLLLRTMPLWENQFSVRTFIGLLGVLTFLITYPISRVQSTLKSKIAYTSIAHIGIIFLELAAGFQNLALIHIIYNALLRTFQLLASPSQVSFLIREQFYHFTPRVKSIESSFPQKIGNTLYMISLKEWNLELLVAKLLWNPLRKIGRKLNFLTLQNSILFFVIIYGAALFLVYHQNLVPIFIKSKLPFVFAFLAILLTLRAYTERKNALLSWLLVIMNHFWIALAVAFNENFSFLDVHIYLSGITVCAIVGVVILKKLGREETIDINRFHGHSYEHAKAAQLFFLACLGAYGFPITLSFIGQDLIFSHIHEQQYVLVFLVALSFVINGIALIRIYARVFLGPHAKTYHSIAYKSS